MPRAPSPKAKLLFALSRFQAGDSAGAKKALACYRKKKGKPFQLDPAPVAEFLAALLRGTDPDTGADPCYSCGNPFCRDGLCEEQEAEEESEPIPLPGIASYRIS